MAKKATTPVVKKDTRKASIPKSVAKRIRLLKSEGKTEEAENLRRSTVESRNQAG